MVVRNWIQLSCLVSLLTLPTHTQAVSDFWTKAQQTLLLSQTRDNTDPPAPTAPIRDPILDNPGFLPLCGNGRIDSKADYTAYYLSHPPMTLTKQQILYGRNDVVNPTMLHNVTILADEECDDGNRLDLDGCSADCMHVDAWTSSCEIAVEIVPNFNNKTLIYEDILYDPARSSMVVSALDGVYSLGLAIGDIAMQARLIASKTFPVTSICKGSGALILYSSLDQTFWRLANGDFSIHLIQNMSHKGLLTAWNDKAHCNADGSIVVHNSTQILYFADPVNSPVSGCKSQDGIAFNKCFFVQILEGVDISQQGASLFQCTNFNTTVTVIIGPNGCAVVPLTGTPPDSRSLLYDVMDLTTRQTAMAVISPYSMDVTITSPETIQKFSFAQYYTPWGALIESPVSSARKLASAGLATSPNQYHFLGDPSVVRMLILQGDGNCGPSPCGLDTRLGYDILDPNPLNGAGAVTWGDVLQEKIVLEAGKAPALLNIAAIKADSARYSGMMGAFAAAFRQITAPLAVVDFQRHPVTHNLWALRRDKLVEISKSGVQLQRVDGKCIPSGIALCPACQWAPSGSTCKPCSQVDVNSWAWNAKCKDRVCTNSRRLLAAGATVAVTNIHFTLTGSPTVITSSWPDAVKVDSVGSVTSVYKITVASTDPVSDMRRIREKLALIVIDVQVVTQPYESIIVTDGSNGSNGRNGNFGAPTSTPQSSQDNTAVVVTAIAVPLVFIVAVVVFYNTYQPGAYQVKTVESRRDVYSPLVCY